jgi:hypothetical protein
MCISAKQIKQTNETLRLPALFIPYALVTDMYQNFIPIVRDTCGLVRYELGSFSSCKKNPEFRSKLKTTVEFTDVGISIPLIKKNQSPLFPVMMAVALGNSLRHTINRPIITDSAMTGGTI